MPTYEYRRKDGSLFEFRQGINDAPLTHCPETGQPVRRIISGGAGVVYKGEGWYVKEYKNKPSSTQAEPAPVAPKDTGSEPKPAKTESKSSDTSASASG